ncbi:adenosylmethionine--8-amino-7-oxononanoate transaminase [Phascolarctobacterium sp.]|uniref:adenosylmethionine--8-amino-7-oxononanoate transaminase n=1 Tax=Phascolarctobacterium sp. TaxID=2049039 RepID=UPI0038638155
MNKIADLQKRDLEHIWHPCSQMKDYETLPPIVITRGKGPYLYSADGKVYLDIISSWWANLLGHANPKINAAITEQLQELEHVIFVNFTHEPAIRLGEELVKILPLGLNKINFADNGSSSVEISLKMAFQYQLQTGHPEKNRFMCLSEGYHGETIGALSVGSMDLFAQMYKPMMMNNIHIQAPDCYRCPLGESRDSCSCQCFKYAEEAFAKHAQETAAIIVEPIVQGCAGMRIYPPLYLQKLRKLCDTYNVLLIADEIATGFGRTGKMFACDHAAITPDLMCISKALTGGYLPMALVCTTDAIYQAFYDDYNKGKAFMHSHTYAGNPIGCATALAVLKIMQEENILASAAKKAVYFHAALQDAFGAHKNIGEIRHIGLINALELVTDKERKLGFAPQLRIGYEIYKKALTHGLLLRPLGNVIYFNPMLNIEKDDLDKAVALAKLSVKEVLG